MSEIRPAPPGWGPPAGHVYVPLAAPGWRLVSGKRCRRMGPGHHYCREPAIAEMQRPRIGGPTWWAYCGAHMYGRWIENGQVMHWALAEIKEPAQ